MSDLGVAIVGCRAVAPLHVAAAEAADGARLVAVCDIGKDAADPMAAAHGVDAIYEYDAVLARKDVDLVVLVTPDELHAPMAIQAAKAGKHVLVEKPIAMSLDEVDAMITASETYGVKMMCAQSTRFRAKFLKAREIIEGGRIGMPVFARIGSPSSPFWTPEVWKQHDYNAIRGPEWLLMHNGAHQFDYLAALFGSLPEEVYTISHPGQEWLRVHEYAAVNIRFANGAMALSEENRIMQPPGHPFHCDLTIVGTEGTLDFSDRTNAAMCAYTKSGLSFPGAHTTAWEAQDSFTSEMQAIVHAIRNNAEPMIPLSFSRDVLRSLRAACKSMCTGENEVVSTYREGE